MLALDQFLLFRTHSVALWPGLYVRVFLIFGTGRAIKMFPRRAHIQHTEARARAGMPPDRCAYSNVEYGESLFGTRTPRQQEKCINKIVDGRVK